MDHGWRSRVREQETGYDHDKEEFIMPESNPAQDAIVTFGRTIIEAAKILADENDLDQDQAIAVAHAATLMLVNGTVYNGLSKE